MTLKNYSSKKGNVQDVALWIVVAVMLMFMVIFGFKIWSAINDKIQTSPNLSASSKAIAQQTTDSMPQIWDSGFLLLLVLIYIVILVFIWFIDIHPVFLVLTFISAILLAVVGGIMNNITETMLKSEGMATTSANFPIMVFVAEHFGIIVFFMILGALVVIFAKWRSVAE